MSYASRQRASGVFQLVIIAVMVVLGVICLQGCGTIRGFGNDLACLAEGGSQSVTAPNRVGVVDQDERLSVQRTGR